VKWCQETGTGPPVLLVCQNTCCHTFVLGQLAGSILIGDLDLDLLAERMRVLNGIDFSHSMAVVLSVI